MSDDWCAELDSALEFLAGERGTHPDDFVPYLQYMPKTQVNYEKNITCNKAALCSFDSLKLDGKT